MCCDVPGRLVSAVNPRIIIHKPGKPAYLFISSALLVLAGYLHQHLSPCNAHQIPTVKHTPNFPYRFKGKACFLIEGSESDTISEEGSLCTKCGPHTSLDRTNSQCIIEHMAAHILHDPTVRSHPQELCGLCLQSLPICMIYLKKGHGESQGYNVDMKLSKCVNLIQFKYAIAATSSKNSPCTNVLVVCLLCSPKSPVVWTYSLDAHFRDSHSLAHNHFPIKYRPSQLETEEIQIIWENRHQIRKKRNMKGKKTIPLVISNAHHYCGAME